MGFAIKATSTNQWLNGIIPFQIDATVFPVGSAERLQVLLAINGWNTISIIKFFPFVITDTDFIFITKSADAAACSSPIGRQGGQQSISYNPNAAAGVIMHELGLIHEHKRPDRNNFITVNNANIATGRIGQFSPIDLTDCPVGPYDCGLIMYYGTTSFSVDGVKQTITAIDPAVCSNIGQRK
ncbi:M12 family metallopeptidase [Methylobacter sp.]|uniref:M12 family metallopeptidase n=1 Tax=Methylobacter sp. TaxID=2051955 RepID=UPI002FDED25D